jgi:hypothetical protein
MRRSSRFRTAVRASPAKAIAASISRPVARKNAARIDAWRMASAFCSIWALASCDKVVTAASVWVNLDAA